MKRLFLTLAFFVATLMLIQAQNNNQNQGPQMIQPNMEKDTVALLDGHFAGPIKAADLAKADSLFLNKNGLLIIGFSLNYSKENDTTRLKLDSKNNKITAEMKTALKALKPGQNFVFSNVRVMAKDGVPRKPTYDFIHMWVEKEN